MLSLVAVLAFAASPSGQIAFLTGPTPEAYRVHVLDLASNAVTPVGFGEMDGPPVWSPDGANLAFETGPADRRTIGIALSGGAATRVLGEGMRLAPAWSADGRFLAYALGIGMETRIAVYDVQTKEERIWGGDRVGLTQPAWLPDNQLLGALAEVNGLGGEGLATAFAGAPQGIAGILAIGYVPDGKQLSTDIVIVTPNEAYPLPPKALPSDGQYAEWNVRPQLRNRGVAFESNDGGDREIFVTTIEGSNDVSNHRADDWNPVWQAKGSWLAFESFRGGRRGIYRVHRDTDRVYTVAAGPDFEAWSPSWSYNGNWLVYAANRFGNPDLFIYDIEKDRETRLTESDEPEEAPAWRYER